MVLNRSRLSLAHFPQRVPPLLVLCVYRPSSNRDLHLLLGLFDTIFSWREYASKERSLADCNLRIDGLFGCLFQQLHGFSGYVMSVRMRKTLVSAMYDKVSMLSMKSLTETNSGKLIALISADIFTVERAISMTPYLLACPLVLILTLFYIGQDSGWEYAGYTLAIWILTILG